MPACLVVGRTRRADAGEDLPDRSHVPVEHPLDEGEELVGRPAVDRVRAQLPGEVLVVGAHAPGEREHHIEQPGHRLGGVEPGLQRAAVAVALEGAVGEVDPTVEPVVLDQHLVGLLGRQRGLAVHGRSELAAGAVEQHGRPGVGPAEPPALRPEGRHRDQLGPGVDGLVDLGGVHRGPGRRGLVGEHHDDVEVGPLGGEPAPGGPAEDQAEQVGTVGGVVALGERDQPSPLVVVEPVGEVELRHYVSLGGRVRTWATPRSTHTSSAWSSASASAATSSHPVMGRPRISIGLTLSPSNHCSASAGSARTIRDPWLAAATAMWPSTMNPSPPNILLEVTPGSPSSRSLMRCASASSYAMAESMRLGADNGAEQER
ncbi:hypothetical protein NOCA1190167 [metagenome]|uniref:Uncharacterized protein n=1 Tax=metagenome TaxID=256318 RepID=A0A2P2CD73_9ZZZZ